MRFSLIPLALLVFPATTLAAQDQAGPRTVEVQLSSFDFTPSTINLHAGQAVTLHLVNSGNGGHNFSAPEFFAAATVAALALWLQEHEAKPGQAAAIARAVLKIAAMPAAELQSELESRRAERRMAQ